MEQLIQKVQQIEKQMNANYVEREGEIRAILLSILAQKNSLFIGAPGVAKSSIIDQFIKSFQQDIQTFTRLIAPTTQPEELFGSARFDRLKEGIIERNVEGQLPLAHFAFLDEIFKATSDLLNGLLKIMNEHRFENGREQIESPLFTLIAASNEFPEDPSLAALYDRFLIRREVQPLKTPQSLMAMLSSSPKKVKVDSLSLEEIQQLQEVTAKVDIRPTIIEMLAEIHFVLKDQSIIVSDRRTKQCLSILQASAVLANRSEVIEADFEALVDCLWNEPDDRVFVEDLLNRYSKTPIDAIYLKMQTLIGEVQQYTIKHIKQCKSRNYQQIAKDGELFIKNWMELEQAFYIESPIMIQQMEDYKKQFEQELMKDVHYYVYD